MKRCPNSCVGGGAWLLRAIALFLLVSRSGASVGGEEDRVTLQDDISTTLEAAGTFDYLVTALNVTGLIDVLAEPEGPFTVFAPLDAAFEAFPPGIVEGLLTSSFSDILVGVLLNHVVEGVYSSNNLFDGMEMTTILGDTIKISVVNETMYYANDFPVVGPDTFCSNGVIHSIAGVLLPDGFEFDLGDFIPGGL